MPRTKGSASKPHPCTQCHQNARKLIRCAFAARVSCKHRLCAACCKASPVNGVLWRAPLTRYAVCRDCMDVYGPAIAQAAGAAKWGGPLRVLVAEMTPGRWCARVSEKIPCCTWAGSEEEAKADVWRQLEPMLQDWPEIRAQFQMDWSAEDRLAAIEAEKTSLPGSDP